MSNSGTKNCSTVSKTVGRIRTLVVDDSPATFGSVRLLLQARRGVEIVGFAQDGEAGVAQAGDLQPDLILMDLQMPRLDGLSAIRMIRAFMEDVRIIVITFMYGEEVQNQCRDAGADGFVLKERLYQDLVAEIQRVFSGYSIGHNGSAQSG